MNVNEYIEELFEEYEMGFVSKNELIQRYPYYECKLRIRKPRLTNVPMAVERVKALENRLFNGIINNTPFKKKCQLLRYLYEICIDDLCHYSADCREYNRGMLDGGLSVYRVINIK